MISNLVISGGSINGLCTLGVLQNLYEKNVLINIDTYIGTSAGAYISFLLNIGYFPIDIYNILYNIDFNKILELKERDIDELYDIIKSNLLEENTQKIQLGMYAQDNLLLIIKKLMNAKNIPINITFQELYEKTNKTLVITGTCVNTVKIVYFTHKTFPKMPIFKALQISSCIPFLFKPVLYYDKLWVDGGCIENYPINYIIEKDTFIGINLKTNINIINTIQTTSEYLTQILNCLTENKNEINKMYIENTINIESPFLMNWDLSNDKKKELYDKGFNIDISKFL